jgi:CDP-2,3-bis-(O-geranylgeranyl)-sn-glycerol synthase
MNTEAIVRAVFLVLAMSMAGTLHVLWLRSRISQLFAWPVDGGTMFRGRRLFGANKQLRGFMVLPPAAAASFVLLSTLFGAMPVFISDGLWPLSALQYSGLGFSCGLAFMLAELPNSFTKRQCDIAPGQAPTHRGYRWVVLFVDRLDSVLGVLLVASLMVPVSVITWLLVLVIGPAMHAVFSIVLHALGIKARAL